MDKIILDLHCPQCRKQLPSRVTTNRVQFIQAVCPHCGWVAPQDRLRFIDPNGKTDYDDIFLEWPRKIKSH